MESLATISEKFANVREKITENQTLIIGIICAIIIMYILYTYGGSRFTAKGLERMGKLSDIETEMKLLIDKINNRQNENLKK
jgi:hypothetical protein